MKLDELQEGVEYAISRNRIKDASWTTPCRARLSQVVTSRRSNGRQERLCLFTLLEDAEWYVNSEPQRAGTSITIEARFVWRPWVLQAQINEQRKAVEEAREANTVTMRRVLGQLGLHDERYVRTDADPRGYDVTVSVAELEKIANAVVEIERLLHAWYVEGVEGHEDMRAAEALHLWCEAHDFGNITG
jgi:hypothetical protein